MLLDVALAVAAGGDCLADAGLLRDEPGVYGKVASDPTVSRLFALLGKDPGKAERLVDKARATARARVWSLAGQHAAMSITDPLVIDVDATLVTVHADKQGARPTFKKGYGHHPLCAFADHGQPGTGEPLEMLLRAGNAGSNTAADHISVTRAALAQLPVAASKKILVRADGAGGTQEYVAWLAGKGVQYCVGFKLPDDTASIYHQIPGSAWEPALDAGDEPRDGAWVSEWTGMLDLAGWADGMRVIVRRERPHPGAQLRFDDVDGYRLTAFVTNTRQGQLQTLELARRRRARCEDRIRVGKHAGLNEFPLQGFDQNRIWCLIIQLAGELLAWAQMLALAGHEARRREPKRLRLRLLNCPAEIIRSDRRRVLRFKQTHPWAWLLAEALARRHKMPTPR